MPACCCQALHLCSARALSQQVYPPKHRPTGMGLHPCPAHLPSPLSCPPTLTVVLPTYPQPCHLLTSNPPPACLPAVAGLESEIGKLLAAARAVQLQYSIKLPDPSAAAGAAAAPAATAGGEPAVESPPAPGAVAAAAAAAGEQPPPPPAGGGDVAMQDAA